MITTRKYLGEYISSVGPSGHVRKTKLATLLQLSSKEVSQSDMLRKGPGAPFAAAVTAASPLPAPSPCTEQTSGLTERHEPESHPSSPVCTGRRVPHPCPPRVPGTLAMALCPSSVPLRVPLPARPESSFPESTPASALVAGLVDFAAACRLDYATALVAESESASPPSVGGECALGTDDLGDRQEDFECLAAAVPGFASMLLALEGDQDAPDIPTTRSYAEAITACTRRSSSAAHLASLILFLQVLSGVFGGQSTVSAGRLTSGRTHRGLHLRLWDLLLQLLTRRCFYAPTVCCCHVSSPSTMLLPPFYVLVYVNDLVFATVDIEALTLVKSELQKRHTCTDLGPLALRLPVLLATAHSSIYQPLALSSTFGQVWRDECTPGMGFVLGGRGPIVLIGHADASWSTRLSSVLSSSCEAEIYAGAMAAQELRWLTYLLTNLGEQPRLPPVLLLCFS
ncbi:unnamed protein product [Closterium sp. NIES-53]